MVKQLSSRHQFIFFITNQSYRVAGNPSLPNAQAEEKYFNNKAFDN
jgi:hypothetical protein